MASYLFWFIIILFFIGEIKLYRNNSIIINGFSKTSYEVCDKSFLLSTLQEVVPTKNEKTTKMIMTDDVHIIPNIMIVLFYTKHPWY